MNHLSSLAYSVLAGLIVIALWSCLGQTSSTLPERQRAYDRVVEQNIERGPVVVDVQTEQSEPVEGVHRLVIRTPEASP